MKSGYGLMFFFGCFDILTPFEKKFLASRKEEAVGIVDFKEITDKELRTEVLKKFNEIGDLRNVSDLFVKPPPFVLFNPIVSDIRIPLSLQKMLYVSDDSTRGEVEEFKLVYDGSVLLVATWCPLDKWPWGVYDVRDRFIEILKPISEFKEVPPCLTHEAVVFVNKGEKVPKETRNIYLEIEPSATFLDIARSLYLRLGLEMHAFYEACAITDSIDELISDIHKHELKLLSDLGSFLRSGWKEILNKRKLVRQGKEKMLKILEGLTEHASRIEDLGKSRQEIEERMAHNALLKGFIESIELDEYCKPEMLDIESSMRIVEHVRKELEIYSVSTSTIVSALIGAIIGSTLTLIVSYCLGAFKMPIQPLDLLRLLITS